MGVRRATLLVAGALAAFAARSEPYAGPIFDAHLHYNAEAAAHYSVATAFELFRKNGVAAILANSTPNDGTRALFEARRANPGNGVEVVPFIRVYRSRADLGTWRNDPAIYAMIVAEEKLGYYRGIGEFNASGNEADTPVVKRIVDFAVARGLILHAHSDDAAVEILFRHNPKARVIWAHTGFNSASPARIEEMLRKYPELWGELSYREGITDGGRLSAEWKALFTKYPTRFMVGADTWGNERWAAYPAIMGTYRNWLGELPPDVAGRIAWGNAAGLFGITRRR